MIAYSPESQIVFAEFYQRYNDIDIYVEDPSLVGLYERLFTRILGDLAKITRITPLGGRDAVINEAKRLQGDHSRKRFFLIDGDFHWLTAPRKRVKNLYQLNCYCIENLAFERDAIISAALSLSPKNRSSTIETIFSHTRLDLLAQSFSPLFELYATAHILNASCTTVAYAPERLLLPSPDYWPDLNAITSRINGLHTELLATFTQEEIDQAYSRIRQQLATIPDSSAFLSGKFLLSVMARWFCAEIGFRGKRDQLTTIILSHAKLLVEEGLAKAIKRVARKPHLPINAAT